MNTTGLVTTVTDELLAELEEITSRQPGALLSVRSSSMNLIYSELRRLRAENAELAQSLAESRANDQAAMGWLTSLRWASGDRGERMLPELVSHIEGLAKDYARLEWMLAEQCIMRVQNGTGSPLVYSLWWSTLGEGQINWHKSARDAIDTAMASQ